MHTGDQVGDVKSSRSKECKALCLVPGVCDIGLSGSHEVIDAHLLELQHDGAQIGAQDLGVRLLLEALPEGGLRVEAEALARLRASGAHRPLVRAGLPSHRVK